MVDRSLVQQLLERLLESGGSVEEVCAEHPELLPEVRRQWQLLKNVQADLDALFPMAGPVDAEPPASRDSVLPQVRGYAIEQEIGRGGMGVGEPVAARRITAFERLWKWLRRRSSR